MVDDLAPFQLRASERAYLQDLHPWAPPSAAAPGCRRLKDARVVTLRHFAGSSAARDAVLGCALPWPDATGSLAVTAHPQAGAVFRRQPEELLLVEMQTHMADTLLAALAPGRSSEAVALDLSHGMVVLALEGPQLDHWLSHLVEAGAMPRRGGSATRTRLGDIAVLLMRLDAEAMWLVADRATAPYLADWLAFAHRGAFLDSHP